LYTDEKSKLESQLKEAYGKVTYSYTTHLKQTSDIDKQQKNLKNGQIVLSAVSTSGILTTILLDQIWLKIISGVLSLISLGIKLYYQEYNLTNESNLHRIASDKLWFIREEYVSLLTDMKDMDLQTIRLKRDELQWQTYTVYMEAPKTNAKSYKKAQKALQSEEEQFFTSEEIDQLLPEHLRSTSNDGERKSITKSDKNDKIE
jgi:hypothetical protein